MLNFNYDDIFGSSKKTEKVEKVEKVEKNVDEITNPSEYPVFTKEKIYAGTPVGEKITATNTKKVEKPFVEKNEKQENAKSEIEVLKKQEVATNSSNSNKNFVGKFLEKVVEYAETSGDTLDSKTKALAVDIITSTNKTLVTQQINWGEVDVQGCGLVSQIKRYAKLGLSMEDKLYVDLRNNNKTGKKDIFVKPQYQALEKLMVRYFAKPILRFKEDVVCVGDDVTEEEDFVTGLSRITSHTRNNSIDRNKLDNIIGAYKIAYVLEGNTIVQYVVKIDKNRIKRAYNASPSREKTVWNLDSRKMVLKTVTWEMWNDKNIRAFMVFPEDIVQNLSVLEESEQMDWNAETKYQKVEEVQNNVKKEIATEDYEELDF